MAFLLNNNKSRVISSGFRLQSQQGGENRRGFHVEPAAREKALLADDPSLRRFKSHKQNVRLLKRAGDFLTVILVAGCCYEIYVKAAMREQARKVEKTEAKYTF